MHTTDRGTLAPFSHRTPERHMARWNPSILTLEEIYSAWLSGRTRCELTGWPLAANGCPVSLNARPANAVAAD